MKYLNNNNEQYILHFPSEDELNISYFFKEELNKKISVNNQITILTTIKDLHSTFLTQCLKNKIPVIKTENNNILKEISHINTEYCLIVKEKDAILLNDLDDFFIEKFLSLSEPFVFAGMSSAFPSENLENFNILFFKGIYKYINSSLIFGKKDAIIEFFSNLNFNLFKDSYNFKQDNTIFRTLLSDNFCKKDFNNSYIDSQAKLFSTIVCPFSYIKDNIDYKEVINKFDYNYIFRGEI